MLLPGVYPRLGPRPGCPSGERALWNALSERLPEGWFAWHSFRVRTSRGTEAEADFVLAIPDRGALVVEVKSGLIEVVDGTWLQSGRRMDRAPREQAHEFRRTLRDILLEKGVRDLWVDIATAFPETSFFEPPPHGDVRDASLGQQDLQYLDEALVSLADKLFVHNGRRVHPPRDGGWLEILHALWGETWVKASRLGHRQALRREELVQLDSQQQELLEAVADNPRMLVRGGPGTGKTLVASEIARRRAAEGARVKMLCFTRALGAALRVQGFDAVTVRELAAQQLAAVGRSPSNAPPESWDSTVWDSVATEARSLLPTTGLDGFDFVVLDEAQDLSAADWQYVRALAGDRPLWVFTDEGQAYWSDRLQLDARAEGFATYRLLKAYRNPPGVERFASQYRAGGGAAQPGPFEGLRLVMIPEEGTLGACLSHEVERALAGGLTPSDIAVLSLLGQTRTTLGGERLGGVETRRADAGDAADHVVVDTFLRFKGLERPFVIVAELRRQSRGYDVRMHIGLTRATVETVVVATMDDIVADPRLWQLAQSTPGDS